MAANRVVPCIWLDDQAEAALRVGAGPLRRLVAVGGEESPCGWVRDRFGLWWQVVPEAVAAWVASDDEAARGAAPQVVAASAVPRALTGSSH